jgi:hypothetical protein
MAALTTDTEFSAALDYLPVAVRACTRNPGSDILWAEAVRAQRAVIEYADAALTEHVAAEVQALVGTIARIAELPDIFDTTGAPGHPMTLPYAERSERAKRHIRSLVAAR